MRRFSEPGSQLGEEGVEAGIRRVPDAILTFVTPMAKKGWLGSRGEPLCVLFDLTGFEPGVMLLIGIR